jgi:hypothetical protein
MLGVSHTATEENVESGDIGGLASRGASPEEGCNSEITEGTGLASSSGINRPAEQANQNLGVNGPG